MAELTDVLASGFAPAAPGGRVRTAVALALDFWAWRRLAQEDLDD